MTKKEEAIKWAQQWYGYDDPRLNAVIRAFEAGMNRMQSKAKLAFVSCGKLEKRDEFNNLLEE